MRSDERSMRFWAVVLAIGFAVTQARAQTNGQSQPTAGAPSGAVNAGKQTADIGTKTGQVGGDQKDGAKPGPPPAASGTPLPLGPLDPAPPPPGPAGRKRIGVALGGGGALALSEIGALQWFEEHHIPVDMVAGTSMGALVGALYATGKTPQQMQDLVTDDVFTSVFRIKSDYSNRSFRRREDARSLPNALTIGLKHRVSFRNSILTDNGLDAFITREFLRYDDQTDFNTLPIPFRSLATDLDSAQTVTFARGSIPDAIRASVSIPGIYQPFSMNGHEYVDGAVLENLPTPTVRAMKADVVLAVSLPLQPVAKGSLDSILGVFERSFSAAIEGSERQNRKLADVVILPDLKGFASGDFVKVKDLAARGYAAAEAQKATLLNYAVSDAEWEQYTAEREAKLRGPIGPVLQVKVKAPSESARRAVERKFAPLVNLPLDTKKVESLLADVRSDDRYQADYTVGYENHESNRPIILVTVTDKTTGPPFVNVGANVEAQANGTSRATVEAILLDQDLGGYGSELRTRVKLGSTIEVAPEYYRKLNYPGLFVAPRGELLRTPFDIYQGARRLSERQLQVAGGGADIGWSDGRTSELRMGWEEDNIRWTTRTGTDALPDYFGSKQRGRVRFVYDAQDRALVPQFGVRVVSEAAYLYDTPGSPSAPQLSTQMSFAHQIGKKNVFVMGMNGGTMLNRNVAQPFRYTLGGPYRLSASAIDEYRGTDYFLLQPAYLRRVAQLPQVLGESVYVGGIYEAGQMRAPGQVTITRQDFSFGLMAETPLGVITLAPAVGDAGKWKIVFTLGRLF